MDKRPQEEAQRVFVPRGPRPAEGKFSAALRLIEARVERGETLSRQERRDLARAYRLRGRA